jgi:hypothetical protein
MASQTLTVESVEQVINFNSLDACLDAGFDPSHYPQPQ